MFGSLLPRVCAPQNPSVDNGSEQLPSRRGFLRSVGDVISHTVVGGGIVGLAGGGVALKQAWDRDDARVRKDEYISDLRKIYMHMQFAEGQISAMFQDDGLTSVPSKVVSHSTEFPSLPKFVRLVNDPATQQVIADGDSALKALLEPLNEIRTKTKTLLTDLRGSKQELSPQDEIKINDDLADLQRASSVFMRQFYKEYMSLSKVLVDLCDTELPDGLKVARGYDLSRSDLSPCILTAIKNGYLPPDVTILRSIEYAVDQGYPIEGQVGNIRLQLMRLHNALVDKQLLAQGSSKAPTLSASFPTDGLQLPIGR